MSEEIDAVKDRVVDIIERTKGTNSAPLNYVLMPYGDPGWDLNVVKIIPLPGLKEIVLPTKLNFFIVYTKSVVIKQSRSYALLHFT